jgi:hypothetical protein
MNRTTLAFNVGAGNGSRTFSSPDAFPGSSGRLDGRRAMSTNTTTIRQGSVQSLRGALGALLAVMLLAAAAIFALNAGASRSGAPASVSDAQVEKALIDHRAGERAPLSVNAPSAEFWAEFRAAEREMR